MKWLFNNHTHLYTNLQRPVHNNLSALPEGDVLWEKRTSPGYINFREKGALMEERVARKDWVSTGNETAPLPAFSTATPKTKIASCVTNEPTLTYPPDLWQSVLPLSSSTCVPGDGTSKDNSWFLKGEETKRWQRLEAFYFSLLLLHSPRWLRLNVKMEYKVPQFSWCLVILCVKCCCDLFHSSLQTLT